jgi:hypothetical protein
MGEYTRLCCLLLCWGCSGSSGGRVQADGHDVGVSGGTGGSTAMGGSAGASVGGSVATGGGAGANPGGSSAGGTSGTSVGGSAAGGSAGVSTAGAATGGSPGITPECSAVGTGPAPDAGQCTKDSDCPNLSSPPVPTFCDWGLCREVDSTGVNRHGYPCALPVTTNLCGPLVCTALPDSQPSCRYPNECMVDADCSHLVDNTSTEMPPMKAVCNDSVCGLVSAACLDGWPCSNDADCVSQFCDLGKCVSPTPNDSPFYGGMCAIDPANPFACGFLPCRALSDSRPRCRSCETNEDCQPLGSSSTCQIAAGASSQSCTQ